MSDSYLCPCSQVKCWALWKGIHKCLLTKRLECVLGFDFQFTISLACHLGWRGKTRGEKDGNIFMAPTTCLAVC